jgi:hypothetical protein
MIKSSPIPSFVICTSATRFAIIRDDYTEMRRIPCTDDRKCKDDGDVMVTSKDTGAEDRDER